MGASFFVSEGEPYVGDLVERNAKMTIDAQVNAAGAMVFSSADLEAIHQYWIDRVTPRMEEATRQRRFEEHGDALDLALGSKQSKRIKYQAERVAQLYLWAEVAALTDRMQNKNAEVVFESTRLSEARDGKFMITTDHTKILTDVDEIRRRLRESLG